MWITEPEEGSVGSQDVQEDLERAVGLNFFHHVECLEDANREQSWAHLWVTVTCFLPGFFLIEKLGDSLSFLSEISLLDLSQGFFSYVYRDIKGINDF